MKLRRRLIATFGLVALVTLLVSVVGFVLVSHLSSALYEVGVVRMPSIESLGVMREALHDIAGEEHLAHRAEGDAGKLRAELEAMRATWARFEEGRAQYEPLPQTKEEAVQWRRFVEVVEDLRRDHARILDQALATAEGRGDPAGDRDAVTEQHLAGHLHQVEAMLLDLQALNAEIARGELAKTIDTTEDVQKFSGILLALAVMALLFDLWLAALIGRSVTRPLEEAERVIRRIAAGDLSARIDVGGSGEIRTLMESINRLGAASEEAAASRRALGANLKHSFLFQSLFEPGRGWRYVHVSPSIERLTGLTPRQLMEDPSLLDMGLVPEDLERLLEARRRAEIDEEPSEIYVRGQVPGGPLRDFLISYAPRRLADGSMLADGIVTDVSERVATERELAEANRLLRTVGRCRRAVVHATEEGALVQSICDVLVEEGGYRLCWVAYRNEDEARSVTAVAKAGVAAQDPATAGVTWADAERGRGPVGTALRTGQVQFVEDVTVDPRYGPWREKTLSNQVRSVLALPLRDARGVPFGALAVHSTKTGPWPVREVETLVELAAEVEFGVLALRTRAEHEQAEQALLASRARMQLALDMARLVYFEYDFATGLVHFEEGFREIFRWPEDDRGGVLLTPEEYVGRFLFPEDAGIVRDDLALAAAQLGKAYRAHDDHRIRRADGTIGVVSVSRILDAPAGPGDMPRLRGALQDITESENLKAQYAQARKMEAVGQLAGGVAHDFNNYLTVILGYSQMLLPTLDPEDRRRAGVEEIVKAAERSAALTAQLLAFSRREVTAPKLLDVNVLVQEVQKMLRRLLGEDVSLSTFLAEGIPKVWLDPGQFQQVLVNLAVNARDAMPKGGTLGIATATVRLAEGRTTAFSSIPPGDYVVLSVKDTGTGIPPNVLPQIFEPFFTTKGAGHGTGLGLSVVYGVVQQSGGYIDVESRPGAGTVFHLWFPCGIESVEACAADPPPPDATLHPGSQNQGGEVGLTAKRVLSAEILRRHGYRVLTAVDGQHALAVAQEFDGRIDLLVTDVVMPRMSGGELATVLRQRLPGLRVLFVSGYTDDAVVRQGVARDEVDFLQKPWSNAAFIRKVREVLDGD